MAIGVMNIFDSTTDDLINGVILLRKIPFYNLDCLQMAVQADCQKFVALSSVQNLLTDIWHGKLTCKSGFKANFQFCISCLSIGFMAPFLIFDRREKLTNLVKITSSASSKPFLFNFCTIILHRATGKLH
jgi:hypothetical protein